MSGYVLSYISDKIGRRPVIMGALLMSIVSMVGAALAPSFMLFELSYFLAGCFLFGYETEVYLYISEISGSRDVNKPSGLRRYR
jgi:MFS family permease